MLLDSGVLRICTLKQIGQNGKMPKQQLVPGQRKYYGERVVGYGRQYAAMGASERVDMLARIWQDRTVRIGMYALDGLGDQYRIGNVQHLTDEDGLKVTDLSLERLDDNYDIAET